MWKLTLYVKKNNAKCEEMRLSKCIKHFDSKCVKIDAIYMCKLYFDAICENIICDKNGVSADKKPGKLSGSSTLMC